ncbi:hepatic lectin-like isoform X2 [Rana temporaria]|nr:hepatic lectin-like isoform X2 [Rana temporaria]
MDQQTRSKGGNKTWVIWIMLGLLFLKFCILLVLMIILFASFNTRILELQKNIEYLNKIKPSCESGWLEFDAHCYFFSKNILNWTQAEKMCLDRDSLLVIINNEAEQKFLTNIDNKGIYWIGLTNLEKNNKFKWVDGTGLSYQFWDEGEPNNQANNEGCVHIVFERWNDSICGLEYTAICEKKMK